VRSARFESQLTNAFDETVRDAISIDRPVAAE
jgi:hypothetical protein